MEVQGESDILCWGRRTLRLYLPGVELTVFGSFYTCFGSFKIKYWKCDYAKHVLFRIETVVTKGGSVQGEKLILCPDPLQAARMISAL